MKGLSFNVTLNPEQIEEIANLTADKVNNTKRNTYDNEEWYKREIENLTMQLEQRDRMIVEREISIERTRMFSKRLSDKLKAYKEKYGEI